MKYFIWSNRHRQWWGPDRQGYTRHLERAGQYETLDAGDIALCGLPGSNVPVETSLVSQFTGNADDVEDKLNDLKRI